MSVWNNLLLLTCIGSVLLPCLVYVVLGMGERILARLTTGAAKLLRAWLWLSFPLASIALVLIYPLVVTIWLAFP